MRSLARTTSAGAGILLTGLGVMLILRPAILSGASLGVRILVAAACCAAGFVLWLVSKRGEGDEGFGGADQGHEPPQTRSAPATPTVETTRKPRKPAAQPTPAPGTRTLSPEVILAVGIAVVLTAIVIQRRLAGAKAQ